MSGTSFDYIKIAKASSSLNKQKNILNSVNSEIKPCIINMNNLVNSMNSGTLVNFEISPEIISINNIIDEFENKLEEFLKINGFDGENFASLIESFSMGNLNLTSEQLLILLQSGCLLNNENMSDPEFLEKYYELSQKAGESSNTPALDLINTVFGSVENFNNHIKFNVNNVGYGTREGVVAAALSLVGDYSKVTGKRLRYNQLAGNHGIATSRQETNTEGIVNEDFYLDCSSFAWFALYNGGYNLPKKESEIQDPDDDGEVDAYTISQKNWAISNGYTGDITSGKPGDFLVSDSHIVVILGSYDEDGEKGYYDAEFSSWGQGAKINKRSYDSLGNYTLMNMDEYYNNDNNVR